jgi:hypothetical protein
MIGAEAANAQMEKAPQACRFGAKHLVAQIGEELGYA